MAFASRFTKHKTQSGPSEAASNSFARLSKRTKQTLHLTARHADAAVRDRKGKANATTRQASRGDLKGDLALPGKLHGVVDQVLKRGPQAHRVADRLLRQVDGEINPTGETGRLRACREARRRRLRKRPRIKGIGTQREIVSLRLYRIDNERCEGLQVPRTAGESRDPAPLALAKVGSGKQIGGGQDTGQRRAHIVGEPGNHQLKRTHTAG